MLDLYLIFGGHWKVFKTNIWFRSFLYFNYKGVSFSFIRIHSVLYAIAILYRTLVQWTNYPSTFNDVTRNTISDLNVTKFSSPFWKIIAKLFHPWLYLSLFRNYTLQMKNIFLLLYRQIIHQNVNGFEFPVHLLQTFNPWQDGNNEKIVRLLG